MTYKVVTPYVRTCVFQNIVILNIIDTRITDRVPYHTIPYRTVSLDKKSIEKRIKSQIDMIRNYLHTRITKSHLKNNAFGFV